MPRPVTGSTAPVLLTVLTVWGCGVGESAALEESGLPVEITVAMDAFVAAYASSRNFNGVVYVSRQGSPAYVGTYGDADVHGARPIEGDTRFLIGSITKTFTSSAIGRLVDNGTIEVEDPVLDHLDAFPFGPDVTIRHLLEHRSGLPNLFAEPNFRELERQRYESPAEVVAIVSGRGLQFEPGDRNQYNNLNYVTLAWLIEELTGTGYGTYLEEELLAPLGLRRTGYDPEPERSQEDLAMGLDPVGVDGLQDSRVVARWHHVGAGEMYSSVEDLARWAEHAGGRVSPSEGAAVGGDSSRASSTFGWSIRDVHGREAISAGGWDGVGYSARVTHLPEESLTVVVLCNLNIAGVVDEIASGLLSLIVGETPRSTQLSPYPLPDDSLRAMAGSYRFGQDFYVPGGTMTLEVRDGFLVDVVRDPPGALLPLEGGGFLYRPTWAPVSFESGRDGKVTGMRFYDRFLAERMDASRPSGSG